MYTASHLSWLHGTPYDFDLGKLRAAAAWGAVMHDNKSATRELLMFQFGLCAACYEAEWLRRRQLRSDPH